MRGVKKTVDHLPMVKSAMLLFAICGFWCPLWWSPERKRGYKFFSVFMCLLLVMWTLSQLLYVVFNINNLINLSTNFLTFIPALNSSCKATNLLVNRRNIVSLLNMLADDSCKGQDFKEVSILRKYEKMSRWLNTSLTTFAAATVVYVSLDPFFNNWNARVLPYLTWLPYTVDSELIFWSTYVYEFLMGLIVVTSCLANDLLVISIMMQISGQFDVLSHRFLHLAESELIKPRNQWISCMEKYSMTVFQRRGRRQLIDNVQHHRFIFQLGEATQRCFVATFAFQILLSLIGSCTSAYLFSRYPFGSPDFNSAGLVFACLIIEAFLYCWFANEIRLKSLGVGDAVYNMDWTTLDISFRKEILNVSMRSRRPIVFTSGPALPLSNDVFVGILNTSYAAFTVLNKVSVGTVSI